MTEPARAEAPPRVSYSPGFTRSAASQISKK